jgi:hypothetical protein
MINVKFNDWEMSSITGHEISLSRFVDLKRELLSHPEPMKCSCSQASRHGWKSSQHTEKMGRNRCFADLFNVDLRLNLSSSIKEIKE